MHYILKTKKAIALLLIVSQLVVNAGMQTFAVSFSKIVDNTLDAMQQPENISTKYYEEFYYESKTYLLNDGNEEGVGAKLGEPEETTETIEETETNIATTFI